MSEPSARANPDDLEMLKLFRARQDARSREIARALRISGIIILVIGLLVAVGQTFNIISEFYYETELLGSLCWIAVGMAIEFFGIGLIIVSKEK